MPAPTIAITRAGADTSFTSSRAPMTRTTNAPSNTPVGSLFPWNNGPNRSILDASANAAITPANNAMPPTFGVGTV